MGAEEDPTCDEVTEPQVKEGRSPALHPAGYMILAKTLDLTDGGLSRTVLCGAGTPSSLGALMGQESSLGAMPWGENGLKRSIIACQLEGE